jgi:hypothetical protein
MIIKIIIIKLIPSVFSFPFFIAISISQPSTPDMKTATLEIHQSPTTHAEHIHSTIEQIHRDNSDKTSEQRKPQKINAPRSSNERDNPGR